MTRGAVPNGRVYQVQPGGPADVPPAETGFLSTAAAAFRSTQDEVSPVQESRVYDGYRDLEDTLVEQGVSRDSLRYKPLLPWDNSDPLSRVPDKDAIWQAVQDAKKRNPSAFASVPATRDAYEQALLTRQSGRARDAAIMSRGGTVANLAGGIAGSFTDPFNVLTAPIGGGARTLTQALLQGAVINGALELVQTPDYIENKRRMGEEVTTGEAITNVALAAAGGSILEGGFHTGGKVLPRAIDGGRTAMENALAAAWPHLPEGIRTRWANAAEIPDSALPDLAEHLIGAGNMSQDERAAVTIMRREADIDAGNPFVANGAGTARHAESLGQAMQRILDEVPGAPPSRPSLSASTSPIALATGDPRAAVKARIGIVENASGSNTARNPGSTALGKYQFTAGTWLSYYKRRYGTGGMSDGQILGMRSDPAIQDRLMDDMMADNAAMLRSAGAAETSGNLYLAHFLGQRGARRVLEADGGTPIIDLVGREAVAANRSILEGKTAADVIAWAHRKMGELPPAPIGARTVLREGEADPRGASLRDRIQADLDRSDAELQAVQAEQDAAHAAENGEWAPEPPQAPRPEDQLDPTPIEDLVPARAEDPAMVEQPFQQQQARQEVRDLIDPVRRIVGDTKQSLRDVEAIAQKLGKPLDDVRDALDHLVSRGELRQRKAGGYVRPPVSRAPVDALRFVAQNGGLSHTGVRGEARGHDLGTIFAGKNGRPQMMQGGPIVRASGHTLDEMGERLWEAGYFGPPAATPRPTEDQVLQLLEDSFRSGRKAHSVFDMDAVHATEAREAAIMADEQAMHEADEHARALGHDLTAAELTGWLDLQRETGLDPDAALTEWINRQFDNSLWDGLSEHDKETYARAFENLAGDAATAGEVGSRASRNAGDGVGREPVGGDPFEGPPNGPDPANNPWQGWEPGHLEGWDEPAGPAAEALADSIEHDIRMEAGLDQADMFGGATRDEKRQALERQTEGGKSNGVDQKPVGSDGGLFDTGARDQMGFQLDEGSEPVSPADLLRQLDEEQDAIDKLNACMVPPKPKGDA